MMSTEPFPFHVYELKCTKPRQISKINKTLSTTKLILLHILINGQSVIHKRKRRYLLFTKDTQWGVFITVAIPLHPETTVSVAWFIEANYYNVDNATYFEPLLGDIAVDGRRVGRSTKGSNPLLTRSRLYRLIEAMLEKHGYPGTPCLLRAICENADENLCHNGLLGDLLHLIFTPSTSLPEEEIDDYYYEAEFYGTETKCDFYVKDCPDSPLEIISKYIDDYL